MVRSSNIPLRIVPKADEDMLNQTQDDSDDSINNNNGGGGQGGVTVKKQYEGQDIRPTSTKEIYGWYSYGWAGEVFALCGMGSFIPVLLEQLARENGHLSSDPSASCGSSQTTQPSSSNNSTTTFTTSHGKPVDQCVVDVLGWSINTASFVMYTFSLSVLWQALIIISMSGAADHGSFRKSLLLGFALIGSISCILFVFLTPSTVVLASILAQIGNICFGASFVLLNAFLPVMVRHHQKVGSDDRNTNSREEASGLLGADELLEDDSIRMPSLKPKTSADSSLNISTKISTNGIAIGYFGGVLLQIACILLVVKSGQTTFSLQLSVFCIGLWWLVFTIPSAILLRPRPGPPLPGLVQRGLFSWTQYIFYAWKGLWVTIRRARRLKDVMLFLAAWFMVSDGVATIASSAMMFAKTNLHMPPASLALIGVILPISGIIGSLTWRRISAFLKINASQTILVCVALFALIPLYGLLGLIPSVASAGFGLTRPGEMYGLAVLYGFVLGGLGGYCRSVFSELIPPGSEAAFYALYAITDKGSSVFGPTVVGLITDRWGDIRYAFSFMFVLLLVPLPILWCVDLERGKERALEIARVRQSSQSDED